MKPLQHGFRNPQGQVIALAVVPITFTEPEDARFIEEDPAYRAHVKGPQFSDLLWRVVPLKSDNPC